VKKKQNKQRETVPIPAKNRLGLIPVLALFLFIGTVYISSLVVFYPNLPIIERKAETIPGFADYYPPFRVDENVYYIISRHILDGILYMRPEAPERAYTMGFPLVAAPFVAVFDKMGGYVANLIIMFGSLAVFYRILSRYGFRGKAIALTLVMAFASLDWFYAISNYSEPLAQLLVLLSLRFLLPGEKSGRKGYELALAGVFTALNLFVRPNYILLAAPFFLYLWLGREKATWTFSRRAWLYAAGVTGIIALWMVRNAVFFGSPFTFEYTRLVGAYTPGMTSRYMSGNIWLGIHRLLFDEYHGLLTITPVFLLFPAGLHSLWEKGMRKESLAFLAATVMMILFVAAGPYPFTEFGLGSRHLVPLIPILLLPAAFFLDSRLFSRTVVALTALYTFYHAGFGWFTGGEPGMGFYLGILNDAQSRAIILARKGLLPKRRFASREELIQTYRKSLDKANLYQLLQTLDPLVIAKINGNERDFMLFLRGQTDPVEAILSADPSSGIIIRSFSVSQGFTDQAAPTDSTGAK
jgi:hypothetical protein